MKDKNTLDDNSFFDIDKLNERKKRLRLIQDLENIARRNGLLYEVKNEATRLMEVGIDEVDALQFACVDWDLI